MKTYILEIWISFSKSSTTLRYFLHQFDINKTLPIMEKMRACRGNPISENWEDKYNILTDEELEFMRKFIPETLYDEDTNSHIKVQYVSCVNLHEFVNTLNLYS